MKPDHAGSGAPRRELGEDGLALVPDATLRRVLDVLQRDLPPHPLSAQALRAEGIPHAETISTSLAGMDSTAQARALALVLADRAASSEPGLHVVWTGPEAQASTARDTAVLLQDLFARAERSVLLAGFRFDHGDTILAPLHHAMRNRGVVATLFADLRRSDQDARSLETMLADFRAHFLRDNWPFGAPLPRIYYDPRQASPYVSLHAKCAVVDHQHTLITSANFTDRGLTRNIELGVLIDDVDFAVQVETQWMGLVNTGLVANLALP